MNNTDLGMPIGQDSPVVMTGGDALARQLAIEGVSTIFGIPGVQIYHAVDAIARTPGLSLLQVRHEQSAAYLADGYARASGRVGVGLVVPGPGVLNTLAGMATAYACCSRVLLISGQVPTTAADRGNGALHEVVDQTRSLRTVTKWNAVARSAAEVPRLVSEAFRQLWTGTPRPVALEIAPDILGARAEIFLVPRQLRSETQLPDADTSAEVSAALLTAERPLIWAGGGVRAGEAGDAILELAETIGAPIAVTRNGSGGLPSAHPLVCSELAGRSLAETSDFILGIGTRFLRQGNPVATPAQARIVLANTDADAFREPRNPWRTLLGDARTVANTLTLVCRTARSSTAETRADHGEKRAATARKAAEQQLKVLAPQRAWLDAMRRALPANGIMVSEYTQVSYPAPLLFAFSDARSHITPGYQGTLGYGYATALGASVGAPDRVVFSVNGDGGFAWTLPELATAKQHGIATIAIVFENSRFGNVARDQVDLFEGRTEAVDLVNPDYELLARAHGIPAYRAESPDELEAALRKAASSGEPALVHVPVGDFPSPWPLLL